MTTFKFINKNGKHYVAANDSKPIVQAHGSCAAMFDNAKLYDGLWLSDVEIKGWLIGRIASDYFYGDFPEYGKVVSGSLMRESCEVVGFKIKPKCWWRTGNEAYRLTYEQFRKYLKVYANKEARDKYLEEVFPPKPKVAKEEPAIKVVNEVPV